jgi:four helix bundle protein
MPSFSSLEDIEVWIQAREFTDKIYSLTSQPSFSEDFSLKDQIRRAANSISLNIAEGYGLGSDQQFIRHLKIARGSCKEVKSALYLAKDQKYLNSDHFQTLKEETELLSKKISSFIQYALFQINQTLSSNRSLVFPLFDRC